MMKKVIHAVIASAGVVSFLIALCAAVPRLAFLLLIPPAVVVTAFAFLKEIKRGITLAAVAAVATLVLAARVDVVITHESPGAPKGLYIQQVLWGRVSRAQPNVYLAGCEPPRFEPLHVLVVRL
jgi:hypothetical protein